MTTTVVNYTKRLPMDDGHHIYIGRRNHYHKLPQSIWANLYTVKQHGVSAIAYFEYDLMRNPALLNRIPELIGKVLVCWKHTPCHGDVLARLANSLPDYAQMAIVWGEDGLCNFCFQCLHTAHHASFCAYYLEGTVTRDCE